MDFGLASIVGDPSFQPSTSANHGNTPRWTAPEIFLLGTFPNRESDVFSFSMVIYEVRGDQPWAYQPPYPLIQVFSGKIPFYNVPLTAVPARIMDGERPGRPAHPELTDPLWELTEQCWAVEPQERLGVEGVIKILKRMSVSSWSA